MTGPQAAQKTTIKTRKAANDGPTLVDCYSDNPALQNHHFV